MFLHRTTTSFCLLLSVVSIGGDLFAATHVRGYTRKDGTYVRPHYRSSPDSSVWNNWSTKGNTNPYTGEIGHNDPYRNGFSGYRSSLASNSGTYRSTNNLGTYNTYPSSSNRFGYSNQEISESVNRLSQIFSQYGNNQKSMPNSDNDKKKPATKRRSSLDYSQSFRENRQLPKFDENEAKQRVVARLHALGAEVDTTRCTLTDLYETEFRVIKAKELADLGLTVDWSNYTLAQLCDFKQRISKAHDLELLGYDCDWREHSFQELCTMELKARSKKDVGRSAKSTKRVGGVGYSFSEYLELYRGKNTNPANKSR